jgi:hypothetical protein
MVCKCFTEAAIWALSGRLRRTVVVFGVPEQSL